MYDHVSSYSRSDRQELPDGTSRWRDQVDYLEPSWFSGKLVPKKIVGYDRQIAPGSPEFKWRGAGLLAWVTCRADVLFMQDDWVSWASHL